MPGISMESSDERVGSRAVACKLPLLDGEAEPTASPLTAEVTPECMKKLQEIAPSDIRRLQGMICAAWGLLLRCYTGQDAVCFYLRRNFSAASNQTPSVQQDTRSGLEMSFAENDLLLNQISRAQHDITDLEQTSEPARDSHSNARSQLSLDHTNTMIWFHREHASPFETRVGWEREQSQQVSKVFSPFHGHCSRNCRPDANFGLTSFTGRNLASRAPEG